MKSIPSGRMFAIFGLVIVGTVFLFIGKLTPSRAQDNTTVIEQPASEGRRITPAGILLKDAGTNQIAVGSLPVDFVRSPDKLGKDGKGRYLLAINSGFGVQFSSKTSRGEQSIAVIDLNAEPEPKVIENVWFPTPQSVNFGVRFAERPDSDGVLRLFVAGGFENKIWVFKFAPGAEKPIVFTADEKDKKLTNPAIDVAAFATSAPSPGYNSGVAAVYPMGIALSPDGNTLFSANNLGDTLGIVSDIRETRKITRVDLHRPDSTQFLSPYDVEVIPSGDGKSAAKAFVSLWGDGTVAVVDLQHQNKVSHIAVDRHPTAMVLNRNKSRLYVVNSNADSVSVIDTASDKPVERINLKLSETEPLGASPEGLSLSDDEKTLYVANAHANAVAVVSLGSPSKLLGFIPTGQYASAVAAVGDHLFIGNGKGTGVENSSMIVNNSGRVPNAPNEGFPSTERRLGGEYSVAEVVGNISYLPAPDERKLFAYTQQVMQNNGLLAEKRNKLFKGANPFKHVIYIIRENRTYDQIFGDLEKSGDGTKADGDPRLAIFGAGDMAKSPSGQSQNITPNQRAFALRFGLLDRFFVNAEASPDGHNWSTAAFSNDYVDKSYRWNYSGRGRTYDFEGFNRLPDYNPSGTLPAVFDLPVTEKEIAAYVEKYVPYLHGNRDMGEPETLYLWDAAKRNGLSYRNYGEYLETISENDVKAVNQRKAKLYPDLSKTLKVVPSKQALEGHFNPTYRNFDMLTPDIMTTESYKAAKEGDNPGAAEISPDHTSEKFRGVSRFSEWQTEFRSYVADLNAGKGDRMPNLSVMHLSSDHTSGLRANVPTPQFYVADNDYALGKLVEEVSKSPYWKDTAIFIVEDDAQDGPDHVDAHRSPGYVISAYNRPGALIHDFHNTVSLVRTMEILLGMPPMNLLDATSMPIDIFQDTPDLTPFEATLPTVAMDNLMPPVKPTAEIQKYMRLTDRQDLIHPDMANPQDLNRIIWYSVRGTENDMPGIARLPAFDLMTIGINKDADDDDRAEKSEKGKAVKKRDADDD